MRRRAILAAAVVVLSLVAPTGRAAAVEYSTPTGTELTGYQDMLFDAAHGHLFISQGSDLLVTDAAGKVVREFTGITGTSGLALDEQNDRLYVARPGAHEVAVVDTGSLTVSGIPVDGECPRSLALVGHGLWFASSCANDYGSRILDALDLRTEAVTTDLLSGRFLGRAVLGAHPSAPGTLLVMQEGSTPGWFGVYDATTPDSGPALQLRAERTLSGSVEGAAFAPSGDRVVVAEWGGMAHGYSLHDLSPVGSPYESNGSFPVAFRGDGELAAGLASYRPGEFTPQNDLSFNGAGPVGYAWVGRRLAAVTGSGAPGDVEWRLEDIYPRDDTELAVEAPRKVTIGQRVRLHIDLATSSAARRVTVFAEPRRGASEVVARPVVPVGGTVVTTVPRTKTHYRVEYAGDNIASPATQEVRVKVRGKVESRIANRGLLHRDGITYARSGRTVWVEARAATAPGGCVTFMLEVRYIGEWFPTKERDRCLSLGSDGRATVRLGFRAVKGEKPYVHRVVTYTKETRDNLASAIPAPEHLIQFCPHGGFCKPPPPEPTPSPIQHPGPVVSVVRP